MTSNDTHAKPKFEEILSRFSKKFHAPFMGQHRVGSPLGAWCLLAFVAANDENLEQKVLDNLGCSTQEAKNILVSLLAEKPHAVALALGSWVNPLYVGEKSVQEWKKGIADFDAFSAKIPTQEELNKWADKKTDGLIKEFPLNVKPEVFIAMMATAVSTDIKWDTSFDLYPSDLIPIPTMTNAWGTKNYLFDYNKKSTARIVSHPAHGKFLVHVASMNDHKNAEKVNVYSVGSLEEGVSEETVMSIARSLFNAHDNELKDVEFADLPLGENSDGSLYVKEVEDTKDTFYLTLPAWKTENKFDLLKADLGFAESFARFGELPIEEIEVAQSTIAEYNVDGFRAGAVTAGAAMRCAAPRRVTKSKVLAYFNKPYAVVATTTKNDSEVWNETVIFDGWISEAVEAVKS